MNIQDHDNYLSFLKRSLTPQRLQHSVGVMSVMGDLAEIYSLDWTQATCAGLLHDAAKDLTVERQLELAKEANIKFDHPFERHPVYLHAVVGAYLVSKELGITDSLVLDAIAMHSHSGYGRNNDTPLARCLQLADILAPIKEWNGIKRLKSLVYAGQMEEAVLLQCGWLIEFFNEIGVPIHPNLTRNFQLLSVKLSVADSFFER